MMLTKTNFENIVIEAIDTWLNNPNNVRRWVTARVLHDESGAVLLGDKVVCTWTESILSFGRRIMNVKNVLEEHYGMKMRRDNHANILKYWFDHK